MSIDINKNKPNFKGTVLLQTKNMTYFDTELIQQNAKEIIKLGKSTPHNFLISKKDHNTMQITAKLKNKALTQDVFSYNVENREKNISGILETMKNLIKNF